MTGFRSASVAGSETIATPASPAAAQNLLKAGLAIVVGSRRGQAITDNDGVARLEIARNHLRKRSIGDAQHHRMHFRLLLRVESPDGPRPRGDFFRREK